MGSGVGIADDRGSGNLFIDNTTIQNMGSSGVQISPISGLLNVVINNSRIKNTGTTVSHAGILVRPAGSGSANVMVTKTNSAGNPNGIFMDGSNSSGPSNLAVRDSVLSNNTFNGIAVASNGNFFKAIVEGSTMAFNAGVGAAVAGGKAGLVLGGNTITANVTGVSNSGGTLLSMRNNQIVANGTDGSPITAFPGPAGQPLQ